MRSRYLILILLVLSLVLPVRGHAEMRSQSPKFIATYFLTNIRCPSCLTIERLTEKTIKAEFADKLAAGVARHRGGGGGNDRERTESS